MAGIPLKPKKKLRSKLAAAKMGLVKETVMTISGSPGPCSAS